MTTTTKKITSFANLEEDVTIGMRVIYNRMECMVTSIGHKYLRVNKILSTINGDIIYDEFSYRVEFDEVKYIIED